MTSSVQIAQKLSGQKGESEMATVTADIKKAKRHVSPAYIQWCKIAAHKKHRRGWREYLNALVNGATEDEALETALDAPRLTAYDII
jgi:hypothetical protein